MILGGDASLSISGAHLRLGGHLAYAVCGARTDGFTGRLPMFVKYLGYDVTEGWSWNNCTPAMARKELNRLAKKRGDIAHRSQRPLPNQPMPHAVTRDEMRKHIYFIKELAKATDVYVQENSSISLTPASKSGAA